MSEKISLDSSEGSYKIQTNNPDQMNKIVDSIFESIK